MTLTVGSLFSGIGGLDLGLERAGMRVIWQCEIDPYACKVLAKHWPDIPNLGDITQINWNEVERPDVICGGYPCQPFSLAGNRAGEHDRRHLWPHMLNAIRHLRPQYAVMENVPGHLSLGLGRVLGDLAESGYDAEWDCIPAAAVGAPHRRDRVFIVAYPISTRLERQRPTGPVGHDGSHRNVAYPDELTDPAMRRERASVTSESVGGRAHRNGSGSDVEREVAVRAAGQATSMADAISMVRQTRSTRERRPGTVLEPGAIQRFFRRSRSERHTWVVEPDVGRVADGVPARVDRLRALGNAVVPQVAELIGRRIVAVA